MSMEAISGRVTKIRTMSNGQPRIEVELDCSLSEVAALFDVGAEAALARLASKPEKALEQEKPKGGPLAKLAGELCGRKDFMTFLWELGYLVHDQNDAASIVREVCKVDSRAKLDHDDTAALIFHEFFRRPFVKWQEQHA